MSFAGTTGLEQGASLKAECPGRDKKVEFSEAAGIRVTKKGKNSNDNFWCLGTDL